MSQGRRSINMALWWDYQIWSITLTHFRGQIPIEWKKFKKKKVTSHLQQAIGD